MTNFLFGRPLYLDCFVDDMDQVDDVDENPGIPVASQFI
jgi:hypothetical protein